MTNINLKSNKRIDKIVSFISKKSIAEIGADHGYITKHAFDEGKINFALLTDISFKCLEKAKTTFKFTNYKVNFEVGDGLEAVKLYYKNKNHKKINQIVIAGMGGLEIAKILKENNMHKNFVLQPQKNVQELRMFLLNNNYKILKDSIVKDNNFYYSVLEVKKQKTKSKLSKLELFFGLTNLKEFNEDFLNYLEYRQTQIEEVLKIKTVQKFIEEKLFIEEAKKILKKRGITNV